jgi:hypothetical protein
MPKLRAGKVAQSMAASFGLTDSSLLRGVLFGRIVLGNQCYRAISVSGKRLRL